MLGRFSETSLYDRRPAPEDERQDWRRFGQDQPARAYGPDEPQYTEADLEPPPAGA